MSFVVRVEQQMRAYPTPMKMIVLCSLLGTTGLATIMPLVTRYVHEGLGRSLTAAGFVLLLHNGGMFLGQMSGGWLYDRIGARPVLLAGNLTAALASALPALVPTWPVTVAAVAGLGFFAALNAPVLSALVAEHWPGQRRWYDDLLVAQTVGLALGSALGGSLYGRSVAAAFLLAGLLLGTAAIPASRLSSPRLRSEPHPSREQGAPAAGTPLPLGLLMLGMALLTFTHVQWMTTFSIVAGSAGISQQAYSLLFLAGSAATLLGQPPLRLIAGRISAMAAQLLLGTGLLAAGLALLLTGSRYSFFLGGMLLTTVGGMFLWPAVPAAAARLAPPNRRGTYQGLIAAAGSAGRMFGPLGGGFLYELGGPGLLLPALLLGLLTAAGCFMLYAVTKEGRLN
jgi:MFS family permease